MIQMPRRSVTRFFIPLIDVLTLLFAMFLLMPVFEESSAAERDEEAATGPDTFRQDLEIARLNRLLREARARNDKLRRGQEPLTGKERDELERLRRERGRPLQQRYAIFVLGIDAKNGRLFYYDPLNADRKLVIDSEKKARALIDRLRGEAGGRDLYFLLQEPRGKSPFPVVKQRKEYDSWFRDVPHGFESPGG